MENNDLKNITYEEFMDDSSYYHNLVLTNEQYYKLIDTSHNLYTISEYNTISMLSKRIQKHHDALYQFQKDNPQANLFVLLHGMTFPFKERMKDLQKKEKYQKALMNV